MDNILNELDKYDNKFLSFLDFINIVSKHAQSPTVGHHNETFEAFRTFDK